jgi:DNA-binding transcriptional LysR family regulator
MRRGRARTGGGEGSAAQAVDDRGPTGNERTNIPTDLLRTFVAICELGSFTKAAHLFDLTQPAVSAHMRRLEAIIGADLIEKNLAGVTLTDTGSEVLRHARRILSINDQIVVGAGQQPSLQLVRIGIPNLYAPMKLAKILDACGRVARDLRVQVRCDHSTGLLRSIRAGYLDLAFALSFDDAVKNTLVTWTSDLVWMRSPDFKLMPDAPVSLISSPNLLYPDRMAMAVLEKAGRRYEIVFTAFDTSARRAAAEAGLGYIPVPRTAITPPLVAEAPGVLPDLPNVNMALIAREDFDTKAMAPLIAALQAVVTAET